MRYVTLGKTGLEVSRLGFGAMRLPHRDGRVDFDESVRLMRRAFDQGVNFVDSQYHYCGDLSEPAVGRAIAGRRDRIVVQTKACYYDEPRYEPGESHRTRLEETLRRLGTDYLDIYLMHSLAWTSWERWGEAWMEMAVRAKEEGLIRHIGLSTHDAENAVRLLETGCFEVVLMQYNMLDASFAPAFARARELGIGTEVMGPIAAGRLAGLSPELAKAAKTSFRTNAELALRYVLSNPDVDMALSGMRSVDEIDENCAVASRDEPLTETEREDIQAVVDEKRRLARLYCSACDYCQPCPEGVAVSAIFQAMALREIWGLADAARTRYARILVSEKDAPASACAACGQCVPKCPQKIDIPARLKEAAQIFEEHG